MKKRFPKSIRFLLLQERKKGKEKNESKQYGHLLGQMVCWFMNPIKKNKI